MYRRRFMLVCTTAVAGLWLRPAGLTTLSRRVVVALGGACSFCGGVVSATTALAGGIGAPVRICRECVDFCLAILSEEDDLDTLAADARADDREPDVSHDLLRDLSATSRLEGKDLEQAIDALRARIDGASGLAPRTTPACSYCDTPQEEARKLLAGPAVFICDGCIADATAVLQVLA